MGRGTGGKLRGRWLIWGLACFLAAALLVTGYVRAYELEQENEALQEQLTELETKKAQMEKEKRQKETQLEARAEALGLQKPDPGEIIILHIRGKLSEAE